MSAHVLLNLSNELGKRDKMRGYFHLVFGRGFSYWFMYGRYLPTAACTYHILTLISSCADWFIWQ